MSGRRIPAVNTDEQRPVTAAMMYQWINEAIRQTKFASGGSIAFHEVGTEGQPHTLYAVEVSQVDVISYTLKQGPNPLAPSDKVKPGHYAIYQAGVNIYYCNYRSKSDLNLSRWQ
jgi:hypothetical protein